MNRRSFLLGSACVLAAPAVAGVLPARATLTAEEIINRALFLPAMRTSEYFRQLERRMAYAVMYGNSEIAPTQFTGFRPFYSSIDDALLLAPNEFADA